MIKLRVVKGTVERSAFSANVRGVINLVTWERNAKFQEITFAGNAAENKGIWRFAAITGRGQRRNLDRPAGRRQGVRNISDQPPHHGDDDNGYYVFSATHGES